MRIAFLCTSGLDNASPRGRWLPIARELAKHGHELHLLLLHPTFDRVPAREREFMCDGVRISNVAQMHVYGLPGQRRYFSAAELAVVSSRAAVALAKKTLQIRPDVIHICKPQPINGFAGWGAARTLRRPFFVDCDDYETEANRVESGAQRQLIRWWEDTLPRHAAGVTVNTAFLRERCRSLGVPAARIALVPNGANPPEKSDFSEKSDFFQASLRGQPIIVYVGTLSTVAHGVDLLLDAWALVQKQTPNAQLLMVGEGDDRASLQAQAQRLGIAPTVHWIGRVPPHETLRYFALAACSVDPVYDTPAMRGRSPLKIVESLAAGVPVVTADVGDRRETLANGAAGVLVQPGDAQALANGIGDVLTQPGLRSRMACAALRRSLDYAWSKLGGDWMRVYDNRTAGC